MNAKDYPISQKSLGAIYTKKHTTFNVWAPPHKNIELALYESSKEPFRTLYPMEKASDGVFSCKIEGDLHGFYYTFIVDGVSEVTDPYSISASANSIRSAVVDLTRTHPEGWLNHTRPKGSMGCDAILYEVHVKDFSAHDSSGCANKGKFLAFTENGTRIDNLTTGLDHLVELGVTHVHLLPVYDFLTVDEEIDADHNYNWGYDPELYNVPEGSYSTDSNSPINRIKELKQAIMAMHEKGLKVVLDVVYNHTYRSEHSNFNILAPNYYHRTTEGGHFSNGSGCGNEFASEAPMGRRFIIESLIYWLKEFKVDGFRFDLMALIDIDTIKEAEKELRALDSEVILYGEPWMGGLSTLPDNLRIYKGVQCDQRFSLFNDDFRDAIKGDNDGTDTGYIHGNKDAKHKIHTGLVGSIKYNSQYIGFTTHPCESINYFNSHDNLILFDKLKKTSPDASYETLIALNKMAFNMIFMAQGTPFFHAGNEFLRDKKGHHNTYNAPTSINAIDWNLKVKHQAFFEYVKGLVTLRKTYSCLRIKTAEEIRKRIHFIEDDEYLEAFKDGIVYVIEQSPDEAFRWLLIAHNPSTDHMLLSTARLKTSVLEIQANGSGKTIEIPNKDVLIECVFDNRGLLDKPEALDLDVFHSVRIPPLSSAVYRLGRKSKK